MELKVHWTVGFDDNFISFIDKTTLIYISGQYVCFQNEESGKVFMSLPSYAATKLAVHPSENIFAVAETEKENPMVYLYRYPSLENFGILKDFHQMDIVKLAFSNSDYLTMVTGIPEYTLSLWNFKTQTHLCTKPLDFQKIDALSVSPVSWKHIVVISGHRIYIFIIEHCGSLYMIIDKYVKLPPTHTMTGNIFNAILQDSRVTVAKSASRMINYDFELPPSARAGVSCKNFKEFLESQDEEIRCICVSHVWSGTGDLYFGCRDGQLIKLDTDNMTFKMILNTQKNVSELLRIGTPSTRLDNINLAGNIKHIYYAREGVYMGGNDGVLRIAKQIDNEISDYIEEIHKIKGSITNLIFNYTYTQLAVVSHHGIIDILSANENIEPPKALVDIGCGSFVGICVIPGGKYIATLRKNGLLQIWNRENASFVSSIHLKETSSSLDASPLWNVIAVGFENGILGMIDVNDVMRPRWIHQIKLHNASIYKLQFSKKGQIVVSGGDDGYIVILSGLVSDCFRVLGITTFEGSLLDLCVFQNPTADDIAQIAVSSQTIPGFPGANKLLYFEISPAVINDPISFYDNIYGIFEEEEIRKMSLSFDSPAYGCVLGIQAPDEKSPVLYSVDVELRCLCKYQIPSVPPKKAGNKASRLRPIKVYKEIIHEDPRVHIQASLNNRFLITYGAEGAITIFDLKDERNWSAVLTHQVVYGGVVEAVFSLDSNSIFSCGNDNTFSCHKIILANHVKLSNEQDYDTLVARFETKILQQNSELVSLTVKTIEEPVKPTNNSSQDLPTSNICDLTWSEKRVMEFQAEEDQQYNEMKNNIQKGINSIRSTVQQMVAENDTLSDLEKIDRQEFELDVETKKKIYSDMESEIKKVGDEIEHLNLAKQYILDVIKKECWDQMSVKGRSLCSFNYNIEVVNFPLKDRLQSDLDQIDMVMKRRMIEIEDGNDRKIYCEHLLKNVLSSENLTGSKYSLYHNAEDTEEIEDEETRDSSNLTVHVDKIAPTIKYLYPQMELETREQKIYQIILLKDIIYQMKLQFNKEFTDVYQKKEQEINRIKEKNARIIKILNDIDMPHLIQPDPELSSLEKPEKLLVVEDHEIKVERYLTDEQRRKLEEDRLAEEERKRREKLDNWRERGLEDMMGGVLEVKREDELKKDIPKPAFLIAGKPQEEWTDEEKKIFEEYERRVKELNEEREKYKKQLEAEYKKLSSIIDDAKSSFDEVLLNLFNRQIYVQMGIHQEEVKILRLQWSLLVDEELNSRRREILELKNANQSDYKSLRNLINNAKGIIDETQDAYDTLVAEEKLMDKAFRREFLDVHGSIFDFITKLYKRRPRNRLLGTQIIPSNQMPNYAKYNPYIARPASGKQRQFQLETLKNAILELDKQDASDTLDTAIYERLCKSRRKRIMKEYEIKQLAFEIADMQAFHQKRLEEEKGLENNELHLDGLLETLDHYRYQFHVNKEIQLVVKQGQVEVDATPGFIHDFTESVLLHRSTIEDLNKEIKELGHNKVKHMTKAKNSKKKFIHLEWELRRMLMEYEDLVRKMREIQCFKITKEVQRYLATNDYDGLINAEIQKMEQTINHLKTHQTKNLDQKKGRLRYINDSKLIKIQNENHDISGQLTELNVQVNERKHINSGFPSDNVGRRNVELRYQKILQRQHLVDLAKSQAREVAVLRSEVERLRMKTFPALLQH